MNHFLNGFANEMIKTALTPAFIQRAARNAARKGGRARAYEALRRSVDRGVFRDVGGWKRRHSFADAERMIEKEKAIGVGLEQGLHYGDILAERIAIGAGVVGGIAGVTALARSAMEEDRPYELHA